MTSTREVFAEAEYAAGRAVSAAFDVPDGDTVATARLDGDALIGKPAGTPVLFLAIETSVDGGQSWQTRCNGSASGGIKRDKIGRIDNEIAVGRELPEGTGRKARVVVNVVAAATFSVSLVFAASSTRQPSSRARHNSVTHDASGSTQGKNVSSLTLSHTVANQADRLLLAAGLIDDGVSMDWSSCVFNTSETMTEWLQSADADSGGGVGWCNLYRLVAPSATTANVVMTFGGTAYNVSLHVTSLYGCHQSTFDTPETSTGTTTDPSDTCAGHDGGMAFAIIYAGNNNFAEVSLTSTDGTQRSVEDTSESALDVAASIVLTEDGSAGGNSLAADATGHAIWAMVMVCIRPVPATLEQEGFRFRADDGDEDAATWLAAQDTNISRGKDTNTRLRVLTNQTGDAGSKKLKLQVRRTTSHGTEPWQDVVVT